MTTTNIGACGCCVQPPQCCCDGGVVTGATEGCVNTIPALPDVLPENVSVVCDWDGLTVVIDEPYITPFHIYYSTSASGGADFSCFIREGEETLDVYERLMICNFELFGVGGGCLYITGNVNLTFIGTFASTGFAATQQSGTLSPSPSVCDTTVENEITGSPPFWCPNPYEGFITTELIIAP